MTNGIAFAPPYRVTTDLVSEKPLIWTERGGHLIATIEPESDGPDSFPMKLARLFAAAPDLRDAIMASDSAHWTDAMRAAIAKAEGG